ncbi:MAG: hypothetical protein AAFQ02_09995 [Bacteroidota bacterium]
MRKNSLFQLICAILVLIWIASPAQAQVTFNEQPQIRALMEHYVTMGKTEDMIDGWRIKIISTTDRRKLESTKYKFQTTYPQYQFSQEYEAPYYSLKVGAFEDRFDVEPLLEEFKKEFSTVIPFRDRILKSELFSWDVEE